MSGWQSRSANLTPSKLVRDCTGLDHSVVELSMLRTITNLTFSTQPKIFVLWCGHASKKEAGRLVLTHKASPKPSTFESERLTIMSTHVSATALEETPHETETTQITISDALRRRAQSVINDRRTDPQWRSIVRYALEINDPWLADIVRRADAGEKIIDSTRLLARAYNPTKMIRTNCHCSNAFRSNANQERRRFNTSAPIA